MAFLIEKKNDISTNRFLKDLTDTELFEVCNIGRIKHFNTGDIIIKEGDADKSLCFILQGSIKVTRKFDGQERDIVTIFKGDGLGDIDFTKSTVRTISAVVLQPSTIMVLDSLDMQKLKPGTQICIYKNINKAFSERMDHFIFQQAKLADQNNSFKVKIKKFLHSNKSSYAQSEIIQDILKNIPRLPMYTNKLFTLLHDEKAQIKEIVDQAKLDPSLVGAILKTINSAFYSVKNKISDVQHAIMLLGFNQVYQLVLDNGIKSTMPNTPQFQELQCHSVITSTIAFEIAKLSEASNAVIMSTIGLLHDIGKSVILLLKLQHQKLNLLIDSLDPAAIGSLLLKEWNVPDIVCKSLEYQSFPEFFPPSEIPAEYTNNVAILYVAHLCYEYMNGEKEKELPTAFLEEYFRVLKFTEGSLSELIKKQIIPALHKKIKTYPDDVRLFIMKNKDSIMSEGLGDDYKTKIDDVFKLKEKDVLK